MEKILKQLFILFIIIILLSKPFICLAENESEIPNESKFGINYNSYIAQPLEDKISFEHNDTAEDKARTAIESLNIGNVVSFILENLKKSFIPSLKTFSVLFSILLISAIIGVFKNNISESSNMLEYISVLCLAWYLFAIIKPVLSNVQIVMERMSVFMVSLIPALAALTGIGGGQVQAGMGTATTALILNYVQSVSSYVIFPAAKVVFVLAVISALSDMTNLSGAVSMIKNACIWGTGLMMTLFTGILFFQSSVASFSDTLSIRGARFVASSFIPVVGGMVGESMRTVAASIMLIKSITGMLGISALIYFIIPPLCALLISKIYILTCAFTSKLIGLKKQSDFLYEINSVFNILNALVISVCLSFIVIIAVFMNTAYQA